MGEVGRQIHLESIIFSGPLKGNNFGTAINVTLDEMAPDRRAGGKRSLEIYRTIASQLFQIGSVESFFEKIEGQLLVAVSADGQTTTIHRYAVADRSLRRELWRGQLQLSAAVTHANPKHAADFFN
jgi:hypothetical protein